MSREKASYRDNIERIKERFPDKEMLKIRDVAAFTGLHIDTVKKIFTFNEHRLISVATLAREMS